MIAKAALAVLAVTGLLVLPSVAQSANITGTWSGGATSEHYYFSPQIRIVKSGLRFIGTATKPVSWTLPAGQQAIDVGGSVGPSCTIPANMQVLKLRPAKGKTVTYTGSVIVIYNLLTVGPDGKSTVPFACQVHIFGANVGVAFTGKSFRMQSIDGSDAIPSVTYTK